MGSEETALQVISRCPPMHLKVFSPSHDQTNCEERVHGKRKRRFCKSAHMSLRTDFRFVHLFFASEKRSSSSSSLSSASDWCSLTAPSGSVSSGGRPTCQVSTLVAAVYGQKRLQTKRSNWTIHGTDEESFRSRTTHSKIQAVNFAFRRARR